MLCQAVPHDCVARSQADLGEGCAKVAHLPQYICKVFQRYLGGKYVDGAAQLSQLRNGRKYHGSLGEYVVIVALLIEIGLGAENEMWKYVYRARGTGTCINERVTFVA